MNSHSQGKNFVQNIEIYLLNIAYPTESVNIRVDDMLGSSYAASHSTFLFFLVIANLIVMSKASSNVVLDNAPVGTLGIQNNLYVSV